MSHFTRIKTKLVDADAIVAALADVGYPRVEVHAEAVPLYGYQGDLREQTAEIVVRRKHVGRASNDIGFKRQEDGTFEAIVSGYDRPQHGEPWLQKLTQRYAYHLVQREVREQGFTVIQEQTENEHIRLVVRRFS